MITTKKVLLTTSNEDIIKELVKFEAIEQIKCSEERHSVWSLNKTPVMLTPNEQELIHVPEAVAIPFNSIHVNAFTKWCYHNGFEPGEYATGIKIDTRVESCVLCSLVGHKAIAEDTMVYNNETTEADIIVYESSNFIVVPELGSIKPGYLMIVPKKHQYLSIAQMPKMYLPEYEQVCEDIETILKGSFGTDKDVSFFEHGSGPSGFTSHAKSIVHAHVHVIIDFTLKQKYLDMVQMKPCPDLSVAANTHYFAYKVGAHGERLCNYNDDVFVQRQYPRQIMAMELGLAPNLYNWRKTSFLENIHTTLYRMWEYLSENELSYRIAERTRNFVVPFGNRFTDSAL
ncbi:MAG: hypothetical protein IJ690_01345 [Clostridia bacterium]|nr:hypothetical protein [Clostridia bacterium]